jgi:hypothetical protein
MVLDIPSYLRVTIVESVTKKPMSPRAKSPTRKTVSKPGLPAIPDMKISHFIKLNPVRESIEPEKETDLKTDFLDF